MGKTINYTNKYAKAAPRIFVIEKFDAEEGRWIFEARGRRQNKMETMLNNMRIDGHMVRMLQG